MYTFSIEFTLELINKYNIYGLCDLNNNRSLLQNQLEQNKIEFINFKIINDTKEKKLKITNYPRFAIT